jgi:hypothetical protein
MTSASLVDRVGSTSFDPAQGEVGSCGGSGVWRSAESRLAGWDLAASRATFLEQDQLLVCPEAFAADDASRLAAAAERLRPSVVRRRLPGYKKSGSVSHADVRSVAPELDALYRSPRLIETLSAVAGSRLQPCPDWDLHACALYYYTEPGDFIGWHFDSSHYRGERFTVLVGIVNRTTQSRLECRLYEKEPTHEKVDLSVSTEPGTLVFFNGDRLWHSVSKLGEGEERIVLTLEYVTDPTMSPLRRVVSELKDSVAYFGFGRRPSPGTSGA